MVKCAYCGNEVTAGNRPVLHCKDGCHRTLFLCRCGAVNRPLASWCRSCGREVSFSNAEKQLLKNLKIVPASLDQPSVELTLDQFGISSVSDLSQIYFSCGYMFLLLKQGKVLILNSYSGDIQESLDLSGGNINLPPLELSVRPASVQGLREGNLRYLFIFTAREIHRLDLIRDFHNEIILSTETDKVEITHQPIYIEGQFFIAIWDESQSRTQLKLASLDGGDRELLCVNGRISQPVRIGSKVFFYSHEEVFVYDHIKRDILYRDDNRHRFNPDSIPKVEDLRAYVLDEKDRIYRISLDSDVPEIFGLPHPQIMQANFNVADGRILVSHSGGVLITNVLGQIEWSSEQLLSAYPAYKFTPVSFGNYIAFVMTYPNTEVLHIIGQQGYRQAASCTGNFVVQPNFYAGQLYVIIEEDEILKMRVYSL